MTAQAAGPRPATSTLSMPNWAMDVPPVPAPPCEEPDHPVRGLLSQLGRFGDAAPPRAPPSGSLGTGGRHGPTGTGRGGQRCPSVDASGAPARGTRPTTASGRTRDDGPGSIAATGHPGPAVPPKAFPDRGACTLLPLGASAHAGVGCSPGHCIVVSLTTVVVSLTTRSTVICVPSSSTETVVRCSLIR